MHGVENSIRKVWREGPLGIPSHRWEGNIRMDLIEIKMVYTHTHTRARARARAYGHPLALLHVRVLSTILVSLVRDPGLSTARGAKEILEVRKVRRGMLSRAIACCLSLPGLHGTTRDSHTGGLSRAIACCLSLPRLHGTTRDSHTGGGCPLRLHCVCCHGMSISSKKYLCGG
jgi:hypothetical protein